jgi:nitroreductase
MNAVEDDAGIPFEEWENPNLDSEAIYSFLAGKRSVRQYQDREIPREVLEQMIAVGELTATASNAQDWHTTIVLTPEKKSLIVHAAQKLQSLFCGLLQNPAGRKLAKLVPEGRAYLQDPHVMDKIQAMAASLKTGEDWILYSAPVVVILSTDKTSALGSANSVLAAEAMMYYLQANGIGSCYIGFAQMALNRSKNLGAKLGIPPNEKVHAVFSCGYSKVKYRRLPHRKKMPVNYV